MIVVLNIKKRKEANKQVLKGLLLCECSWKNMKQLFMNKSQTS